MSRFVDVPDDHPHAQAIERAAAAALIVGVGGGYYRPDERLTEAQIRLVLTRLLKIDVRELTRAEAAAMVMGFLEEPPPSPVPVEGLLGAFPVRGVKPIAFSDTWGAPRPGGRPHRGVDIFAKRNTPLQACVDGVIEGPFGESAIGGLRLWINSRWYYAHLQAYAPGIGPSVRVEAGQVIGYCGNSGDAKMTPPHLHFGWDPAGTHGQAWANPYPLLRALLPL